MISEPLSGAKKMFFSKKIFFGELRPEAALLTKKETSNAR